MNHEHAALGVVVLLGLTIPVGAASAAPPPPGRPPTNPTTVTLITGDRVTLDGSRHAAVRPGRGREHTRFFQQVDERGDVHVIPEDVTAMLRTKRMDPRLFNVTQLAAYGFDDAARHDIPLIVSGNHTFGAKVRDLPSVRGAAVRVDKTTGYHAFATDQRIWLDGPVKATLDQSVPRIGAPEAWKAGYKGQGTTVAVLDSGIDATHPDLAGAVGDARDFTGSATGTDDHYGHGTHVASIITGENTKYEGIAPDTRLLVGKVLDDSGGGAESWIIAGMQWAADRGANVVNMSLGSPFPDDGTSPMSLAVNDITAKTGTLFVIAAGNNGGLIGAPGSAAAALTVGAVDHDDHLAPFSSRGPR